MDQILTLITFDGILADMFTAASAIFGILLAIAAVTIISKMLLGTYGKNDDTEDDEE